MTERLQEIGQVKLLQVQQSRLIVGERPNRYYDPKPLLTVECLELDPEGVVGLTADGGRFLDVHHVRHPQSRYRGGNAVSIGFTSHYAALRERFGPHLWDGCAGENIIVATDRWIAPATIGERLAIGNAATGDLVYLSGLRPASPCVQFTQFAAGRTPLEGAELQAALQSLDNGARGYYASLAPGQRRAVVQPGDRVYRVEPA